MEGCGMVEYGGVWDGGVWRVWDGGVWEGGVWRDVGWWSMEGCGMVEYGGCGMVIMMKVVSKAERGGAMTKRRGRSHD